MSEQAQELSVEERARTQGWTDKDEFRGDPEVWVNAETFVERGENINPILRERNAKMERELNELKRTMSDFTQYHKDTADRAYTKAREDIVNDQAKAIEDGDGVAYKKLDEDMQNLEKAKVDTQPKQEAPEMTAFRQVNDWYETDTAMTDYADMIGVGLSQRGYDARTFYAEVEKEVKQRFPDKFDNNGDGNGSDTRQTPKSPVEGGGRAPRAKGNKKSFSDLPAEAKATCDRFVKNMGKGADGNPKFTREQFVADYKW